MDTSNGARLRHWLAEHGRHDELAALDDYDDPLSRGAAARRALRTLNRVESLFDDLITATRGAEYINWDALRAERGLLPARDARGIALLDDIAVTFTALDLPPARVQRLQRIWRDFLLLQERHLQPLQLPAGWLAALDYLHQCLYFTGSAHQAGIARRHAVSLSTVGLRFRALVETLDLQLFDNPARKRLVASRALAINGKGMSESEFNRRLLQGDPILP
jgi:hypothetical protein